MNLLRRILIGLVEVGSIETGVLRSRDSCWKDKGSLCRGVGGLLFSRLSLVKFSNSKDKMKTCI